MAFDDIVRVADLKSRASRWARVRTEVKAGTHDVLKVYDHFKPGAPEFAALLPHSAAQRVLRWDRQRSSKGQDPWALRLKIGTHSVLGMFALRTLAWLKWLRPLGSRFATEQTLIDQWLAGVLQATARDWQSGFELAQCGRLIKGYGSTNERGKDNLVHILEQLAQGPASALAAARTAALADEAGKALDQTLVAHGAAARPVKSQPIRWVKKPKALPGQP
jgi:indolepyruvate ferredoxin oxidoreductase beta subunit